MKKLLTVLAAILLTVSLLAAVCTAAAGEEVQHAENPVTIVEMDTPVSSDAAENYIKRAFGLIGDAPRRRLAPLTGSNLAVYEVLAPMVRAVAAGESSSTECEFPFTISSLEITTTEYTAADLGVSALIEGDYITNEAYSAYCSAVFSEAGLDIGYITLWLKSSLPYDMYWYGNMYGWSFPVQVSYDASTFYVPEQVTLSIRLFVSPNYSAGGAEGTTNYDTSYGTRIRNAAVAANSIVSACAGQPVYDRLVYYRNAICNAVSYNYDALNAGTPYGDPWQAVNVFDGDPDTNVVCEGYSKAFKYLCDLSHFSGVNVSLVTGDMDGGTGAGPHMWNLVSVSGKNYLVDVIDLTSGNHMAGGVIRLSATFRYGDTTWDMHYGDCRGCANYSGQGRVTVNVEAVPAENYLFAGWYSGVEEDAYQQTLTPVGACQSLNPEWSFVAEGEGTWTPYCAVFRYIPPTIGEADLTLPDDLTRVEDSAFEGIKAASVYVPDACTEIGDNAFKGCASLTRIRLPKECDIKGDDAFEDCITDPYTLENGEVLVIYAPAGGSTQEWAEEHHILFAAEE